MSERVNFERKFQNAQQLANQQAMRMKMANLQGQKPVQQTKFIQEFVQKNQGQTKQLKAPVSRNDRFQQLNSEGIKMQVQTEMSKKTKRLRKNFDILGQAIKNSRSTKQQSQGRPDKKFGFSSSERVGNPGSNTNSIGNKRGQQVGNILSHIDQNSSYVNLSHTPQKEIGKGVRSQSETRHHTSTTPMQGHIGGPSAEGLARGTHQGLYSHISLKETSPLRTNSKDSGQRGPHQQHNLSVNVKNQGIQNQQQLFQMVQQQQHVGKLSGGAHLAKGLVRRDVQQQNNSRNNSSAVLNISTASDINIYNNSFILNTTGKKLPQTMNQSRSTSSSKRNLPAAATKNQQFHHQHMDAGNGGQAFIQAAPQSRGGRAKFSAITEAYQAPDGKKAAFQMVPQRSRSRGRNNSKKGFKQSRTSVDIQPAINSQGNQGSGMSYKNISQSSHQIANSLESNSSFQAGANRYLSVSQTQLEDQRKKQREDLNRKVQMYIKNGKQQLLQKKYTEAISTFEDVLEFCPTSQEAKFYLGLSYLDSDDIPKAIQFFNEVIENSPQQAPLAFILLSIGYQRQNNLPQAIEQLTVCITKFPKFADARLARGQGFLLQDQFEEALTDFKRYSELNPEDSVGFIGIGDSQKALGSLQESIQAYSKALQLGGISQQQSALARLRRGHAFYLLRETDKAIQDFEALLENEGENSKAHFYIGKILSRNPKKQQDAILHFEQVAKISDNELYAGNALFEIAKLRLKDKDFYEAFFNLKRAVDNNFNSKRMQLYKDFTEGVLQLIRRKIKKGVQILSDLLEVLVNSSDSSPKMRDYLVRNIYVYRAYGFVAIEKYENAIDDIRKARKMNSYDAASYYNKYLGKGILRMDHEDYIMATKYFGKASLKFPENKDTYCLMVIAKVKSASFQFANCYIDQEEKYQNILELRDFVSTAIKNCHRQKEPSLYFFRGLLNFHLYRFYEALKDFNVAIEEEEEPTANYYLARGRCFACLSILSEAMKDLSIALNLDETLQEAYINRGKCAYLLGDNNLAFLDFQRLILTDPKNPIVHVYAGNLLMTTGAYHDSIKAFQNADTVKPTAVAAFQRARCYCALTDLESAVDEIESALLFSPNETLTLLDKECLIALKDMVLALKTDDAPKGLLDEEQQMDKVQETFNSLISAVTTSSVKDLKKKDSPLNIQTIPNVERIKLEKQLVGKQILLQERSPQELSSLSIDTSQTVKEQDLKGIPVTNNYYENIFSVEDFILYRGVCHFYRKNFKDSQVNFKKCMQLKQQNEKKAETDKSLHDSLLIFSQHSNPTTPLRSQNSSHTDLSDVGLCSFNVHENNYNQLLCLLLEQKLDEAILLIKTILGQVPPKYQKCFLLLNGLIRELQGDSEKAEKSFKKIKNHDVELHRRYFVDKVSVELEPFPVNHRLCGQFPFLKLKIVESRPELLVRPSFSMPFIKPPNMIPNVNESNVQGEFNLKQIDAPMPEAPWIRRCEHGIRFTDTLHEDQDEEEEESKSVSQNKKTKALQSVPKTSNISEAVIRSNKLYLVDENQDAMSDKHKISLFEDSKIEEEEEEKMLCDKDDEDHRSKPAIFQQASQRAKQIKLLEQYSSSSASSEEEYGEEEEENFMTSEDDSEIMRDSMVLMRESGVPKPSSKLTTKKTAPKKKSMKNQNQLSQAFTKQEEYDDESKNQTMKEQNVLMSDLESRGSMFRSRDSKEEA